jgi:glycosyltransferase involved in cell wall biosynthesis
MKILHTVESYLPARHGMSEVVRQISERLVAKGHEVTVATGKHPERTSEDINGVKVVSFSVSGKSAIRIFGDTKAYQEFLLQSSFDVITNFAAQQWATDLMFPILDKIRAKKVLVPTGFSALKDPAFAAYFDGMRSRMEQYDACVYLSENYRDINFARAAKLNNEAIITNAAAADEFDAPQDGALRQTLSIPGAVGIIMHVSGYLSAAKGQIEAIRIFSKSHIENASLLIVCPQFRRSWASELTPRNLARGFLWLLCGSGLRGFVPNLQISTSIAFYRRRNERFGRSIRRVSLDREATVSAFKQADLLLFPSWIECSPLVLFEAAAAGTPFLVTDVGNSQEIIRWTGGGRILPGTRRTDRVGAMVADVPAGARLLDEVWSDRDARKRMGESARASWRRHFTWEHIADRYERLYLALLNNEDIRGQFKAPPEALTQ